MKTKIIYLHYRLAGWHAYSLARETGVYVEENPLEYIYDNVRYYHEIHSSNGTAQYIFPILWEDGELDNLFQVGIARGQIRECKMEGCNPEFSGAYFLNNMDFDKFMENDITVFAFNSRRAMWEHYAYNNHIFGDNFNVGFDPSNNKFILNNI